MLVFKSKSLSSIEMEKIQQYTLPLFVFLAVTAFHLAINIFIPCLPSISDSFQAHRDIVQLSVGFFLIGSGLANLVYGILSDQVGRKPILLLGLGIFFGASLIAMFSPNIEFLIVLRTLQGVGAGCITANCLSLIQEKYNHVKAAHVISWIGIIREVVIAASPILGGYMVVAFGWRSTFLVVALVLLGTLLFGRKFLPDSSQAQKATQFTFKPILKDYKAVLSNTQFIQYISLFPLLLCGLWSYITVVSFYFISVLGIPPNLFGYYIAPAAVMYSLGSLFVSKCIERYGLDRTIMLGARLCLSAALTHLVLHFTLPGNAILIVIVQSIYVLGLSFVFAPSINKAVEPFHKKRATANSLGAMFRQLSAGLGGVAGSIFDDSTILPVALFLTFLSGIALVQFQIMRKWAKG